MRIVMLYCFERLSACRFWIGRLYVRIHVVELEHSNPKVWTTILRGKKNELVEVMSGFS